MTTKRAASALLDPVSLRRLRRRLGLTADPPVRVPEPRRLPPVRRSWPAAVWQARTAVLSGTPIDEYLRVRLARYLAALPVPSSQLPVRIELVAGDLVTTHWQEEAPAPPPAAGTPGPERRAALDDDGWAMPLVGLEGPSVIREAGALRARLTALELEAAAARRRASELSERFADDVAAGRLAPAPRPEEPAVQLGRPPVRGLAPLAGLVAFAGAAVAAQAWAIAATTLAAAGRSVPFAQPGPQGLGIEPILTCVFALGVSVGLIALVLAALRAADEWAHALGAARRRRVHAAAFLAAVVGAATAAAATLPAPRSGPPPPAHALLLLAVSAGVALVLRRVRREAAERAVEAAAALTWDRERARTLGQRARRQEELEWAEASVRELEQARARAQARLDQLERRAAMAAALLARAGQQEREGRARLARSLVVALERDRYEFVRQATARGATHLVSAPLGEPHPPLPDQPPAPVAGRMAG